MLDYAANAVVYWPVEEIRAKFEETCGKRSLDPDDVLRDFLKDSNDFEAFWQKAKTNLQAGKIRMLFVADKIPQELRRVVEFLNEQMDPAEVLAIEIKQYAGQGWKSLVPRVHGQTEEARTKKNANSSFRQRSWNGQDSGSPDFGGERVNKTGHFTQYWTIRERSIIQLRFGLMAR